VPQPQVQSQHPSAHISVHGIACNTVQPVINFIINIIRIYKWRYFMWTGICRIQKFVAHSCGSKFLYGFSLQRYYYAESNVSIFFHFTSFRLLDSRNVLHVKTPTSSPKPAPFGPYFLHGIWNKSAHMWRKGTIQ
jgi:hypothetical protein